MEPGNIHEPIKYVRRAPWQTDALNWLGSRLFWISAGATLALSIWLVYYAMHFAGVSQLSPEATLSASELIFKLKIGLTFSLLLFGICFSVNFAGDFALPVTLFGIAALFFFAPSWLPWAGIVSDASGPATASLVSMAMGALSFAGIVMGVGAVIYQVVDVSIRVRQRIKYGGREETIGKTEVKEEEDEVRNVFFGKCWQLPFCRSFIRKSCPIYHSRRTCWKERVGCMCEESVILDALHGKVIPRDAIAAARYIPTNTRLNPEQKAERCRNCVIYNEHQRHKYKLLLPTAIALTAAAYVLFHEGLLRTTNRTLQDIDSAVSRFAFTTAETGKELVAPVPGFLDEMMLILIMLFVLAQMVRLIEFAVFKLKI
jgi:hypothetical protein